MTQRWGSLAPFGALAFAYFASIGVFNPYATLWFKSLGFSTLAIGAIAPLPETALPQRLATAKGLGVARYGRVRVWGSVGRGLRRGRGLLLAQSSAGP